jgi:hypothetical protein
MPVFTVTIAGLSNRGHHLQVALRIAPYLERKKWKIQATRTAQRWSRHEHSSDTHLRCPTSTFHCCSLICRQVFGAQLTLRSRFSNQDTPGACILRPNHRTLEPPSAAGALRSSFHKVNGWQISHQFTAIEHGDMSSGMTSS